MITIKIEELSYDEYSFTFSKLTTYENGINFLIKLKFLQSINNNPLLSFTLDESIIDNENLCKFVASPKSINI